MALNPALVALFNNYQAGLGGLHVARLYTITLFGGDVIRFTDADFDINAAITLGNNAQSAATYTSRGVGVDQQASKTQAHWKVGTDTDSWTLVVIPRPFDLVTGAPFPDTIGSVPWLQAAQGGALDAADFQVDEAYFSAVPSWPMPPAGASPVGCLTIFAGTIAEVDTTNSVAVLTVNDYRQLLTLQMPLHYFQSQCRHTLFDSGCQISSSPYRIEGSAGAGSTPSVIIGNGLPAPRGSGTYQLGRIVMFGGLNKSFSRTIKYWDGAFTLSLLNPFPFAVEPGDSFVVFPGCDKLFTTCGAFNNQINYGGQPFIPPPETQSG
jgi:hypothetical protein